MKRKGSSPMDGTSSKSVANSLFEQAPNDTFANITAQATVITAEFTARTIPPVPPKVPGDKTEVFRYINEQLDCFGKGHDLLGRYHLLGPNERRAGGAPHRHLHLHLHLSVSSLEVPAVG